MISWVPLLGATGWSTRAHGLGLVDSPVEWLLFSDFSVVPAFVTSTMFAVIADLQLDDAHRPLATQAASDSGASGWQTLWNVIVRCRAPASDRLVFIITIVMGDFVTIGVMGGQQIASIGKIIQVRPRRSSTAASAMILLAVVLIIWGLTRLVDVHLRGGFQ
jgi:putative spermidine/putrescine transport system permease protein